VRRRLSRRAQRRRARAPGRPRRSRARDRRALGQHRAEVALVVIGEQLDELDRVGVDAVLIGETLMRSADLEAACRELTDV
jgi:hypothetical protein